MGQIIACCLMAPSHNPIQYWLLVTPICSFVTPLDTSYDICRWWKYVWMNNCQNVTRLQWVKRSISKGPVCANFTDTHRRQFYWIYNGYFHLKFKHVNKSHISFKAFIVNKSWRLFQMPWFFSRIYCPVSGHRLWYLWLALPNAPRHTQGSVCPTRHFRAAGSRASKRELLLTCPTPSRRTVVNPGQSKCPDWYL